MRKGKKSQRVQIAERSLPRRFISNSSKARPILPQTIEALQPPQDSYYWDPVTGVTWKNGQRLSGSTPGPIAGRFPRPITSGTNSTALQGDATAEVVDGKVAAAAVLESLVDPFGNSQSGRYPDTFTMIPTAVDRDYSVRTMAWFNGTSGADGSGAMALRGEGQYNNLVAYAVGTDHAITWNGNAWTNMVGTVPTNALCRITGAAWRFTFNAVGDIHDIVFNVMEMPPSNPPASPWTNFPTHTNVGPNTSQREVFNGRQFIVRTGETVQLTAYPMDIRATQFIDLATTRAISGLSGYIVWWYGGKATDMMTLETRVHYEFVVPAIAVAPTATFSQAVVKPDTVVFDKAMGLLTDAQSQGLNVVKGESGTLSSMFTSLLKQAVTWVTKPITDIIGTPFNIGSLFGPTKVNHLKWAPFRAHLALAARGQRTNETLQSLLAIDYGKLRDGVHPSKTAQEPEEFEEEKEVFVRRGTITLPLTPKVR